LAGQSSVFAEDIRTLGRELLDVFKKVHYWQAVASKRDPDIYLVKLHDLPVV